MKGHLFFIGIVGHAMRGLALAAHGLGYEVTGLDPAAEDGVATEWLSEHKLSWSRDFEPAMLDGITAVIVTGAHATRDFPAIIEAEKRRIPIKSSAQLFGELTSGEHVVSVVGTHGKTTTTSLITWILESNGAHPDFLIGIRPFNFDTSVRLESSKVAVVEGDEYRASMLETKSKVQYYHPDVLVLTSVEHDHPDLFPTFKSVEDRFTEVVKALPASGRLIVCADNKAAVSVAKSAPCPVTSYSLESGDYIARDIVYQPTGIEFDIARSGTVLGRIAVGLYGKHNVWNVLAATAAALEEHLTINEVVSAAASFKGAYRRFNVLSPVTADVTVIDDYAHHPTEVATNIEAAKLHFPGRRVVVLFRPHTYSRTQALLPEYKQAFTRADLVYITGIEGAREAGSKHTVSGNDIVQALKTPALYVPDRDELLSRVKLDAKLGDVLLCFTVSGYEDIAGTLATELNQNRP
ncbi:MAG TPA: Mur ligase family protein [Candidatus Saccharimonadia bacterium]|nr:Mur ligase family protein [Candidatus Saccharimonadia bacterium]